MNDEACPAANDPPTPPREESIPEPNPVSLRPRPWSFWFKKLLVCNPFYLASAALLLYGVYRVSVDPNFLATEVRQLVFNFSSLEGYEVLLVGTAIFLSRRLIWYDAKLLVVLENVFVLIPFILVSQAALIEQRTVWLLCAAAAVLAAGRTVWLRRRTGNLMPAGRALLCGGVVLLVNTALPILYRHFHETKFGTKLEAGPAYEFNRLTWLMIVPLLCGLTFFLPKSDEPGKESVRPRGFPLAFFLLWLAGTGVHLYCLGYVYDFDLSRELLAPGIWVLVWALRSRLTDFVRAPAQSLRDATLVLPLLATMVPLCPQAGNMFFLLNALNLPAYGLIIWKERGGRLAPHLAMISFAALVASLPPEVLRVLAPGYARTTFIFAGALVYPILWALRSRNPTAAIFGAIAAALAAGAWLIDRHDSLHWAAQAGFAFFLVHSLRWRDCEHRGATGIRAIIACAWAVHSVVWACDGAAVWHPMSTAGPVFFACACSGLILRRWPPMVVPVAASLSVLAGPLKVSFSELHSTPTGILAMAGSVFLFAAGTAVALTKQRWQTSRHQ